MSSFPSSATVHRTPPDSRAVPCRGRRHADHLWGIAALTPDVEREVSADHPTLAGLPRPSCCPQPGI
jgi:hypothetical protein